MIKNFDQFVNEGVLRHPDGNGWYDETRPPKYTLTDDDIKRMVLSDKKRKNDNYDVLRSSKDESFVVNMLNKINKNLETLYIDAKNGDITLIDRLVNIIELCYDKTGDERYIICRNKMLNYIQDAYNEHFFKNSNIGIDIIDTSKYKDYSPLSKDKTYSVDFETGDKNSRLATVKDRKKGTNGKFDHEFDYDKDF